MHATLGYLLDLPLQSRLAYPIVPCRRLVHQSGGPAAVLVLLSVELTRRIAVPLLVYLSVLGFDQVVDS